eukprot:CAMPEP_0178733852 /NCGR_PEP_ID=MMETSP0744-20121128/1018_1 /TAXON_ID=913974 /ORGANISM="Nitzschia punctata, Strain CCMP561" /LENGTH=485 /DNA_ID=CAMNT_0020386067 /DNA_START=185 /DNA_END=1642 /DNA_ORIENTATION=-
MSNCKGDDEDGRLPPPPKRSRRETDDLSIIFTYSIGDKCTDDAFYSILMNAASYLRPKDRLSLAGTCKKGLQVVEKLCEKKLKHMKEKHLKLGGLEVFQRRINDYLHLPVRQGWQGRPPLPYRYQLWAALQVPIYDVHDAFGDLSGTDEMNTIRLFQVVTDIGNGPLYGITCELFFGCALWNNETRTIHGLLPNGTNGHLEFEKLLSINGGQKLVVFVEVPGKPQLRRYYIYDGDITDHSGLVPWDLQPAHDIPPLHDCIPTSENDSCLIYVRRTERGAEVAEVGTMDVFTGNFVPSFTFDTMEELQDNFCHGMLAICNRRWLLVLIGTRLSFQAGKGSNNAIVVYDLVNRQKVQTIKGNFQRIVADPHQLSTIYVLTVGDKERKMGRFAIDGSSGHISWISSFKVFDDYSALWFVVDFENNIVVMNNGEHHYIYDGASGELLRESYHDPELFGVPWICSSMNEVLLTDSIAGLPEAYCLDEPWF